MPARRSNASQEPPPPPYDSKTSFALVGDTAGTSTRLADQNQTIPKSSELERCESLSNYRLEDNYHNFQPDERSNSAASQQVAARRRSRELASPTSDRHGNRPSSDAEFVDSLVAPRTSCWSHISIEPLAFLAIVALYLEFPAIQDLIYTKICLEVVSSHQPANFTVPSAPPLTLPSNLTTPPPAANAINFTHNPHFNDSLSPNGRIQAADWSAPSSSDLRLVCNRLNKTAVPREVRKQILDLNSLFWLKYQILICLVCALSSPYWGGVSDKIGRVLPLNVPIVASIACNSISLAFSLLISLDLHALFRLEWLYAVALLVGLSGGQVVLIMNIFSFISDNTSSEERSKRVTVIESVSVVAHSAGFFLAKLIMSLGLAPGDSAPWLNRHLVAFGTCLLLNALCVLYSLARLRHRTFHRFLNNFEREQQEAAVLGVDNLGASASSLEAESEPTSKRGKHVAPAASIERLRELTMSTPDDPDGPIARTDKSNWSAWDTLVTFRYYRETWQIATKARDTRLAILLLLLAGFLSALCLATLMSLLFIYVKQEPFNWPTSEYSAWNASSSITRGLALIGLTLIIKFAPARCQMPDALVAALGFLAKGAGLLLLGLAHSSSLLHWSLLAFTLSEFSMPPIRSLLSKLVVKEELCKIYSCLGALQSLCFILGNVAFYIAFNSYMQQDFFRIAFYVVAAIEFGAVILVLLIHTTTRRQILVA